MLEKIRKYFNKDSNYTSDYTPETANMYQQMILDYEYKIAVYAGQPMLQYQEDGLLKSIIDLPIKVAMKNWITITEEDSEEINGRLDDINFKFYLEAGLRYARLFGSGVIILGFQDGENMDQELTNYNPDDVEIIYSSYFGEFGIINENMSLREPSMYTLGRGGQEVQARIHPSRIIAIKNNPLFIDPMRAFTQNNSVMYTVKSSLKRYNDYSFYIDQLIKLSQIDIMSVGGNFNNETLQKLVSAIAKQRDIERIIGMPQNSDYKRIIANIDQYVAYKQKLREDLSAESYIPTSILFGERSSGISNNGEREFMTFYNYCESIQESILKPAIKKMLNYLYPHRRIKFEFNPIDTETQTEIIQNRQIQANIDNIYLTAGVLSPEEVRESRFKEGYSYDFNLQDIDIDDLGDFKDEEGGNNTKAPE